MSLETKQMARMSKKSEKNEKEQKKKLKMVGIHYFSHSKAIEKGNMEGARIYAQNAIREKNQALNYLRLASRIEGVASRVEAAVRMKQVTKAMGHIVKGMDEAMKTMDMAKITQVMDQFEKQFEDLDVQSEYVEQAMNQSTSLTTPADQVDTLISQVAEEHGLEISAQLGSAVPATTTHAAAEQDELTARLNKLKGL